MTAMTNRADLPPECDRMPRGLIITHVGADTWPTTPHPHVPGALGAAIAAFQAEVDRERGAA